MKNRNEWKHMKKTGKIRWIMLIVCIFAFMGISVPVQAAEEKADADVDQYCLYIGQTVPLADLPEGEILLSDERVINLSSDHVATAMQVGKTKVSVRTETETVVYCMIEVKANELLSELSFDQNSYPAKVLGAGTFRIEEKAFEGLLCHYTSENSGIAQVDQTGTVTPVSAGTTNILVDVTDSYGGTYHFAIPIRILRPHFSVEKMNLAKGCTATLMLQDAGGLQGTFTSSNTAVLTVRSSNSMGVTIRANKTGKAVLSASISGVVFSCTVTVTNPKLKVEYGFYQTKKGVQLKVSGTNSASVKQWVTENSAIASVSKKGYVKTKKMGSTVIQCRVDGKVLKYYLAVSTKKAVAAMRYGYKQLGKKKYSQARRMSRNYFDCSSFVYRCYRAAGKYLVRKTSWAPVAADIAKYYVRKGKRITAKTYYDESKLRPGDLICFGGKKAKKNGRYQRIYHIAIYIGNGKTMESSSTYNNVVIRDRGKLKKSAVPVVVRPA